MKRVALFILTAALCSALPAAIITRDNTVFSEIPAPFAFSNGISSSSIPYGTYTQGHSDRPEILRVTSNLVGVVASVFDGFMERFQVPEEFSNPPITNKTQPNASTEVWEPDTLRIIEKLNTGSGREITTRIQTFSNVYNEATHETSQEYYTAIVTNSSNLIYQPWFRWRIEPTLLDNYEWQDDVTLRWYEGRSGLASYFGSGYLDILCGGGDIPSSFSLSTIETWTNYEDFAEWCGVFPVYGICTNDAHFFPPSTNAATLYLDPYREVLHGLLRGIANVGMDYYTWVEGLNDYLCRTPCSNTVEDVLKIDPGFEYPDDPSPTNSYIKVGRFELWDEAPVSSPGWEYEQYYTDGVLDLYVDMHIDVDNHWSFSIYDRNSYEFLYDQTVEGDSKDSASFPAAGGFGPFTATRTWIYPPDDFRHWRNMTRRLDWKRLGIICQTERHMETLYKNREPDLLDAIKVEYLNLLSETGRIEAAGIFVDQEDKLDVEENHDATQLNFWASDVRFDDIVITGRLRSASFGSDALQLSCTTSNWGRARPTARVHQGPAHGSVEGGVVQPFFILTDELSDMLNDVFGDTPMTNVADNSSSMRLVLCPMISTLGDTYSFSVFVCGLSKIKDDGSLTNWPHVWAWNEEEDWLDRSSFIVGGYPVLDDNVGFDPDSAFLTYEDRSNINTFGAYIRYFRPTMAIQTIAPSNSLAIPEEPTQLLGTEWVRSVSLPTLDAIIAGGDKYTNSLPYEGLFEDPNEGNMMYWDVLVSNRCDIFRSFGKSRYSGGGPTKADVRRERWRCISQLDQLVKNKFREEAGGLPEAVALRHAEITQANIQELISKINQDHGHSGYFVVSNSLDDVNAWCSIVAFKKIELDLDRHVTDDSVSWSAPTNAVATWWGGGQEDALGWHWMKDDYGDWFKEDHIKIGEVRYSFNLSADSIGATNTPCRVDGYQSRAQKTIYNFKNMTKPGE